MTASRRGLLATSVGAAASLLLPRLQRSFAAPVAPRRLLIVYMPNGTVLSQWKPRGGLAVASGEGDARAFELGEVAAPLLPVREQVTILDGLSTWKSGRDNHGSPLISTMTARAVGKVPTGASEFVQFGTGPSVDQVLRERSPHLQGTAFSSLQLSCDTRTDRGDLHTRCMSYDRGATPLEPEDDPAQVYQRIFGVLGRATTTAEAQTLQAQQRGVLDFMMNDLRRLRARVPGSERSKLDAHLEGMRELERRLVAPALLPATGFDRERLSRLTPNDSRHHPEIVRGFLAIIANVFALDLCRVITLAFGGGTSHVSFAGIVDGAPANGVHGIAHAEEAEFQFLPAINRWYLREVAGFVERLRDTPDVGGGSVLDNTLVVLFSETGERHGHDDVPALLLGGRALGHLGGRVLNFASPSGPARYLSDLWPALAPRFEVTLDDFGDRAQSQGALPRVFG